MIFDNIEVEKEFFQGKKKFISEIEKQINDKCLCSIAFRKIFIILQKYFIINRTSKAKVLLRSFLPNAYILDDFISPNLKIDNSFFSHQKPFPPYDLFVINYLLSYDHNNFNIQKELYNLFRYYKECYMFLSSSMNPNEFVYLNDTFEQEKITVKEALNIINNRLCYLIEMLIILYYSMSPNQMISCFLVSSVKTSEQNIEIDNFTLSIIGRVLLSNGDIDAAEEYFNCVTDDELKMMNYGFISFYCCDFVKAEKIFSKINNEIAKINQATCLIYLGQVEKAHNVMVKVKEMNFALLTYSSINSNYSFICNTLLEKNEIIEETFSNFPENNLRNPN